MSAEYLASIATALSTTFAARLRRQWNRVAVTAQKLEMLPTMGQGGGKQIGWDVQFSGAAAQTFAEGSDVGASEFAVDPIVPAVLPFGMYRSAFQLSNLEIKAAMSSVANAAELGRIVMERMDGSLSKLASVANKDFWSGTGTGTAADGSTNPTIFGFNNVLLASGVYAGLNRATYAEWGSTSLGNGGTGRQLTTDLLYQLDQLIYVASGKSPKIIMAAPDVYRKYAGLFETIKRVFQSDRANSAPNFAGGENELSWKGMPVYRDKDMTAGTLAMLNTDDIRIRPLAGVANQDGVPVESRVAPSSNGEDEESTPIFVDIYPLARTGSAQKFAAEMYLQLQVERPNSSGMIIDIG